MLEDPWGRRPPELWGALGACWCSGSSADDLLSGGSAPRAGASPRSPRQREPRSPKPARRLCSRRVGNRAPRGRRRESLSW
uniref:Uncharacterized protein n=1 Tax=Molossus molossus TaxID=27622 RepID=A0A7J8IYX2_MOLMO|nr:hypothetical protein HJG59_010248 [Molossus molossus]